MASFERKRIARRILGVNQPAGPDTSLEKVAPFLRDVRGKVLEIGPGGGAVAQYLDRSIFYVGLEPNRHLHSPLLTAISERGFMSAEIITSTAEELPFGENEFDAVVSVRTLCSMHDLPKVLANIKRVLKPGGIFIFVEHVAAPKGNWRRMLQRLAVPAWRWWIGCNPAVEIGPAIERAGFSKVHIEPFTVGGRRNVVVRLRIFGTAIK